MKSELQRAIEQGNLSAVTRALDHGADLEERDLHGHPGLPLRTACFLGELAIVAELLRRGANAQAPNDQGAGGPARAAARGRHHAVIRLLAEHGADLPHDLPHYWRPTSPEVRERRRRSDRRVLNFGPPNGLRERRLGQERRATLVCEVELSEGQWSAYFAGAAAGARPPPPSHDFDDTASMVLARARARD